MVLKTNSYFLFGNVVHSLQLMFEYSQHTSEAAGKLDFSRHYPPFIRPSFHSQNVSFLLEESEREAEILGLFFPC